MATYSQSPATLDITAVVGDDVTFTLDFDINLTGYTFAAKRGADSVTVTAVNLAAGQISVSATDTETTSWGAGRANWWISATTAGGYTRTFVSGSWTQAARE